MKNKQVIIFVDRDGTLNYDDKYYLGSQRDWNSKVKILPHVVSGLKLLNKIPNSKIYMITNQPGIAVKEFPLLTISRAKMVCEDIMGRIEKKGARIDGYELCQYANLAYIKSRNKFTFYKRFIKNSSCIKPNPGMIRNILEKEKLNREDVEIYVIGDRALDVKTALNIKGFGIIVCFRNEKGEKEKIMKLKNKNTYIAKNFLDAAKFIHKRVQ
jgi:histidinol-phosphate phosphatase family protein